MTYAANDVSAASGIPVEFYRLVGSLRNYRYCDQAKSETLNGEVYEPLQISRSDINVSSVVDGQKSLMIGVPADNDLATDYGGALTPTKLSLTVYRAYRGDNWSTQFKQRFKGNATGFGFDDDLFNIEFKNVLSTDVNSSLREVYYQSMCNHILYDARCKANKAANTHLATVVTHSDQALHVDDDGFANGDLAAGTAVNTRTGEERLIIGNVVNVVRIGYPFVDIVNGDTVQLIRGCNHGTSDCITKFDNYVNYGGFLFLPGVNPFENEF